MALLLGVACGSHDASACLYDEYELLTAVQLERVTRVKSDGGRSCAFRSLQPSDIIESVSKNAVEGR